MSERPSGRAEVLYSRINAILEQIPLMILGNDRRVVSVEFLESVREVLTPTPASGRTEALEAKWRADANTIYELDEHSLESVIVADTLTSCADQLHEALHPDPEKEDPGVRAMRERKARERGEGWIE